MHRRSARWPADVRRRRRGRRGDCCGPGVVCRHNAERRDESRIHELSVQLHDRRRVTARFRATAVDGPVVRGLRLRRLLSHIDSAACSPRTCASRSIPRSRRARSCPLSSRGSDASTIPDVVTATSATRSLIRHQRVRRRFQGRPGLLAGGHGLAATAGSGRHWLRTIDDGFGRDGLFCDGLGRRGSHCPDRRRSTRACWSEGTYGRSR